MRYRLVAVDPHSFRYDEWVKPEDELRDILIDGQDYTKWLKRERYFTENGVETQRWVVDLTEDQLLQFIDGWKMELMFGRKDDCPYPTIMLVRFWEKIKHIERRYYYEFD